MQYQTKKQNIMVRTELISQLNQLLDDLNITNQTNVEDYGIWLSDGGEDHLVTSIEKHHHTISFIVLPDLDSYNLSELSDSEIENVIELLD